MATKKKLEPQSEQSRRFVEKARELGLKGENREQEKAFVKVGLAKPKQPAPKK